MRINVAMVLLLLLLPVLIKSDTCTDLAERLRILEAQNSIDHANIQASINIQGNKTKSDIDARFNLVKSDTDSSFMQLQKHTDERISIETSPTKQVIPIFLTALAIELSTITYLVWRGH